MIPSISILSKTNSTSGESAENKDFIIKGTFLTAVILALINISSYANARPMGMPTTTLIFSTTNSQIVKTVEGRIEQSQAEPLDITFRYGPWAKGVYNKTHSSWDSGFNGYTQGAAVGFDFGFMENAMIGVGYANTKTKVRADLYKTNIYGDSYFIYGKYQPNNWYTSGIFTYGRNDNKKDENISAFKYETDTYSAQAMVGYEQSGYDNYSGLRYTYIHPENYLFSNDESPQKNNQVITAVIGSRMHKNIEYKGFVFKPELRIALLYDIKSTHTPSIITLTGANISYATDGKRLKRFGSEFGVGITTHFGPMDFSLNYDAEFRSKYVAQTGMIDVIYNF